ncbi:transglycosylase SLT domain-containing protein [Acidovorax sp. NCPPB 4044]|uniref:transglycosylase SLT domain-containing protein n=1 Tax=Acidovorax sp. NCPPB 4044 TaxID=2940490 RepID=UPI002303FD91|nr:transglycosylase SLT domain-containing protein [Acidovorax sp. NCPPB 4044]MDA8521204.1 transglycosylase SLT domain-containing protein [Acidovorax sp. NCPPB 4044]
MKLLHILGLASVLWLTGCAAPGTATKDAPASPTTGTATSTAPLFPTGPLRPITAVDASHFSVASLAAPADLWDRMRRGFAMPDLDQDLVRDRELWYATRPDYMQRMTERSSKYLFHIVEELELRGMPTELALLPYIESAFNPMAVSSAKAVGMWQFMPATGSDYQLKQNAFRDDRRDVLASTRAALDYLQRLYGMFGDWHLALAAYNWGEGNVSRAIARNQKQGLGTSYTDLNMPAETRMYVPKLQAVKNIVANPERFNTELPLIENHPYFQTVDITRDIDVSLVASLAGVREEDFRALNPSLHKPIILAAGMPQILLPWDNAQVFRKNLEAYTEGQYASWTVWSVPTTMSVSAAAQRVGMSEADLRSVNKIPPRMLIKAGSALMVPRNTATQADVPGQVADNGQVAFTPETVTRRTMVKAGKRESVSTIARRYKVTTADVATWNDVKATASFKVGEQVVVYLPVRMAAGSSTSGRSSKQAAPARSNAKKAAAPAPSRKGGTPSRVKKR